MRASRAGRALALATLAGCSCASQAQEHTRFGLNLGFAAGTGVEGSSASLGATLHAGAHFGFRPALLYSRVKYDPGDLFFVGDGGQLEPVGRQVTQEQMGGGLTVLYYLRRTAELSPYLFGGVSALRTEENDPGATVAGVVEPPQRELHTRKGVRAGFGVQYALKERLALFGELGVQHSFEKDYQATASFRSNLGLTFYLK